MQNPLWPIVSWSAAFNADPNDPAQSKAYSDLSLRVLAFSCAYGKQYELGTIETGEADLSCRNVDEALNPANTGSAFNSAGNKLVPYRAVIGHATWPSTAGSGNLLNPANAAQWGWLPDSVTFEGGSIGSWIVEGSAPPTLANDATHAHDGTKALRVTWPTAVNGGLPAVSDSVFPTFVGPCKIGQQYTVSVWLWGATGIPKMRVQVDGVIVTSAAFTSAFQRVAVTFTATALFHSIRVFPDTNTTAGQQVWIDSPMWEIGAAANAFTTAGPVIYPLHSGFIETYPTSWSGNGYQGMAELGCIDAMAFLPRKKFMDVLSEDLEQDAPVVTFPLNEAAPAGTASPASWSKSLLRSQPVTAGDPATKPALGHAGSPSIDGGTSLDCNATDGSNFSYLYFPSSVVAAGVGTSMEVWLKRSGNPAALEIVMAGNGSGGHTWDVGLNTSGQVFARTTTNPATPTYAYTITDPGRSTDNDWHHVVITESVVATTVTATLYVDGTVAGTATRTAGGPFNVFSFNVGATGCPFLQLPYQGLAAYASMYSTALTAQRVLDHHDAAASGHRGDRAGARARRLLVWAGYLGQQVVPDGYSPMGGAKGLADTTLADGLLACAKAENGDVLVFPDGDLALVTRDSLYLQPVSTLTLGEDTTVGEIPYLGDISYVTDPQYVFNDVTVTGANDITTRVVDTTSIKTNFESTLTVDTLLDQKSDVDQLAAHFLTGYKQARQRVSTVTISPAVNPTLWPAALGLKFGDRVTVKRRTPVFTQTADFFVVRRTHQSSPDGWKTSLELAPVGVFQPWILGNATYGVLGSTTFVTF